MNFNKHLLRIPLPYAYEWYWQNIICCKTCIFLSAELLSISIWNYLNILPLAYLLQMHCIASNGRRKSSGLTILIFPKVQNFIFRYFIYLTVKQFDALWKDHWRPQVDFVTNRGFWDLSAPSKCPFPWTKIDFCSNLSLEVRLLRRKCLRLNDLVHCYQAWALSAWEVLEVIRVSKPPANSSSNQGVVDLRSDVPLLALE